MQLTTSLKRFASTAAILGLGFGVLGAGSAAPAQAATSTHLTGTVVFGNSTTARAAGAQIFLQYMASNGQWVSLGHITNANSSGNYSMYVTPGWEYRVAATDTQAVCGVAGGAIYSWYGWSAAFVPTAATANATVHLNNYIETAC
jgi:hypothetical protein